MGAVVQVTTGLPGAGKTFARGVSYLVKTFLPLDVGTYWTNLPLRPRAIAEYVAKRRRCFSVADLEARIVIIPPEVCEAWRRGKSGPWEYFEGASLEGGHIALDEVHEFMGREQLPAVRAQWVEWVSLIRHHNFTLELIDQDDIGLPVELMRRCGIRTRLIPGELIQDPFFKVCMDEWYDFWEALGVRLLRAFYEEESVRLDEGGRWRTRGVRRLRRDPALFPLYDSYSGGASDKARSNVQRLGRWGVIRCFVLSHGVKVFSRAVLVVVFWWACFGGGIAWGARGLAGFTKRMGTRNLSQAGVVPRVAEPPVPGSVGAPGVSVSSGGSGVSASAGGAAPAGLAGRAAGVAGAPVDPVAEARAEVERLQTALTKLETEVQARFCVVVIEGDRAVMSGGVVVRVGDVYGGSRVVSIDPQRGAVTTEAGRCYELR